MRVRTIGKLAVAPILLMIFVSAAPAEAVRLVPGEKAPGFCLSDIDGRQVTLEQFRGKTVVIAFWSTWCSRCEEELTFLRDAFRDRQDVAVLLVNQDSNKRISIERIRSLKQKLGINFPILLDENFTLWEIYGINALPTSVVIGKNGEVRFLEANFYWATPERLLAAVRGG